MSTGDEVCEEIAVNAPTSYLNNHKWKGIKTKVVDGMNPRELNLAFSNYFNKILILRDVFERSVFVPFSDSHYVYTMRSHIFGNKH